MIPPNYHPHSTQLANRDRLHLPGALPTLPGAFFDRAKVDAYELLGCVSICLTLPFTHQPHRLDSILRVGQYIGKEVPIICTYTETVGTRRSLKGSKGWQTGRTSLPHCTLPRTGLFGRATYIPTPLADYLQIFESDLDVGYNVSHCTKEVVINIGLHGIDLWLQDQDAKHPG